MRVVKGGVLRLLAGARAAWQCLGWSRSGKLVAGTAIFPEESARSLRPVQDACLGRPSSPLSKPQGSFSHLILRRTPTAQVTTPNTKEKKSRVQSRQLSHIREKRGLSPLFTLAHRKVIISIRQISSALLTTKASILIFTPCSTNRQYHWGWWTDSFGPRVILICKRLFANSRATMSRALSINDCPAS